jgi:predicted nucleotidyltransferase
LLQTQKLNQFLHGSWAYGEPKLGSDLDIYLVIPDNDVDICDLNAEIRFALYKNYRFRLIWLLSKKAHLTGEVNS